MSQKIGIIILNSGYGILMPVKRESKGFTLFSVRVTFMLEQRYIWRRTSCDTNMIIQARNQCRRREKLNNWANYTNVCCVCKINTNLWRGITWALTDITETPTNICLLSPVSIVTVAFQSRLKLVFCHQCFLAPALISSDGKMKPGWPFPAWSYAAHQNSRHQHINAFPSVFVQATLKHNSVGFEFETEAAVKYIKKSNHCNIYTGLLAIFWSLFVTLNRAPIKSTRLWSQPSNCVITTVRGAPGRNKTFLQKLTSWKL